MSRTTAQRREALERALAGMAAERGQTVEYAGPRHVRLRRAADLTGYTVKALERKIETGTWPEGVLWVRAPDGTLHIDMVNYGRWVVGDLQ